MHCKAIAATLLLSALLYVSQAQMHQSEQCLCAKVYDKLIKKNETKDIQIYNATTFCSKVEILVILNDGFRYCLNPKMATVQKIMAAILSRKTKGASSRVRPTRVTSTTTSTAASTSA